MICIFFEYETFVFTVLRPRYVLKKKKTIKKLKKRTVAAPFQKLLCESPNCPPQYQIHLGQPIVEQDFKVFQSRLDY